jgi:uncharacterized protein
LGETPGVRTADCQRRTVVAALLAAAVCGCTEPQPPGAPLERVTVGTGPAGTLYNQIGTALTTLLQRELGLASTARPYTGSSIYLPQMHRGELPFGLNNAADTRAAYRGELVYARPLNKLRVAMLLSRAPYGYYVKADSGIRSIAELSGQPIVTSFRSIAPFDQINQAVLATAGLTFADVHPVSVAGVPDSIRALVEGRAAAASSVLGIPALREAHATVPGGLRILPLGPNEEAVTAMEGFSVLTLKPGPAMVGIAEPTRVPQMDVYLNTSSLVSDEDVYRVVRTFHLNWAELQKTLPAFRSVAASEQAPLNIGHPFHEGAIRYFKETGLWTPAHQRLQESLLK